MPHTSRISENLGYLTVLDQPKLGLIGGYLVLNPAGRPLEFHCTTPIKPNRAQEILYGNTLAPFLYGDQIAQTLIARSKVPAAFVLTNVAPALVVQNFIGTPVIYVFEVPPHRILPVSSESEEDARTEDARTIDLFPEQRPVIEISEQLNESLKAFGIENNHLKRKIESPEGPLRVPEVPGLDVERWKGIRVGNRKIALPLCEETAWNQNVEDIKNIAMTIDLAEPFTRIRLAIDEAQRVA